MEQKETFAVQPNPENPHPAGTSTFGWDTTFTTTYSIVNKNIKERSTYPKQFHNTENAHTLLEYLSDTDTLGLYQPLKSSIDGDSSVKLDGYWGQWQLELRGNGNTIYVKLPVTSGSIALGDTVGALDNGYIIAEVALTFESQNNKGNTQRILTLTASEKSQVTIVDHCFPGLSSGDVLELLVEGAFKRYLNTKEVLKEFRYVFSTVDINEKATGDFAWLKPSDTGYAIFVPERKPKEADSLFSILCMTENTTAPSYIQQSVDASVFQGKSKAANAVLCISPRKFCKNLLIIAATKMIVGTSPEDFAFSTNGMEIHNVREITFKDVAVSPNETADLTIHPNNFYLHLVNDHLELGIINASFSRTLYTAYLTLHQNIAFCTKKHNGKTIFVPRQGDEFKGEISAVVEPTTTAKIIQWVGVALDILSAVLLIGAGAAKAIAKCVTTAASATATITNASISAAEIASATTAATNGITAGAGAARGITIASGLLAASSVCTVLGLPLTLVNTVAIQIAKQEYQNVPALQDFAENFISEISWTGVEKMTLVDARLNDALLMDFQLE